MAEATVYTGCVSPSPSGDAVRVEALVLTGAVKPGMFLRVPLNGSFDVTLLINDVVTVGDGELKLLLDSEDAEAANFIMALNFSDETLRITDDGEV